MQNAVAFSNNDVITIAWSYGKKPTGCMGFAVHRIDEKGKEVPLPSQAVFKGQTKAAGQNTDEFPIQKFYWKDVYARLIAEKTGNQKFTYKVIPMKGTPGKLVPMTELSALISNEVEITPKLEDNVAVYFNRGLISTQRVAKALGKDKKGSIIAAVNDLTNPLRDSLSGDMVEALTEFVARAKTSGKIYAALYELGDEQLIKALESLKQRLFIVLSNSAVSKDDKSKPKYKNKNGKMVYHQIKEDGNQDARDRLTKTTNSIWNRIMPSGHIGHNKFLVYVDKDNKPQAVLFGSTNWTATGLCTQTNNSIVIDDTNLAKRYLNYWKELKKDCIDAGGVPKDLQSTNLRTWGSKGEELSKIKNIKLLGSWFSPNTPKARSSKKAGEKCPPDMNEVIKCINGAKHAILFLAFYPGAPSLANWSALALKKNKDLFVRGCVTNPSASEGFYYELKGIPPPEKVKGQKKVLKQDNRVFAAEAFDGKAIPSSWQKEILKAGFAIIHDKVMVIDPFSKDCVVITGSHNLGYKASYDNDENLVIIKGNKLIAMAYATHVLDVYDHFSFRKWYKENGKAGGDYNLEKDSEKWLGKYFNEEGKIKNPQLKFWMESTNELG